jgi:hypothetical protein
MNAALSNNMERMQRLNVGQAVDPRTAEFTKSGLSTYPQNRFTLNEYNNINASIPLCSAG